MRDIPVTSARFKISAATMSTSNSQLLCLLMELSNQRSLKTHTQQLQ